MSRPRKPFGNHQPGRLPSTMLKVLAAEMSDPARLRRGKQYAKDGSVLDIIVEPGVVTCEVQGSRSTPYIASLEVTAGDGMPLRRDVHAVCTCPDDDNWDDHACKHVIATMFTFADELLIEPELLDVWRGRDVDRGTDDDVNDTRDADPDDDPGERDLGGELDDDRPQRRARHLQLVRDGIEQAHHERDERAARDGEPDPEPVDPLAELLATAAGTELPDVPVLERAESPMPRRPELAAVLRDAYANLRLDWD